MSLGSKLAACRHVCGMCVVRTKMYYWSEAPSRFPDNGLGQYHLLSRAEALKGRTSVRQVQFWAPQASGAGVSLIMAYLNGNAIPDLLSLRALVAKFSGAPARHTSMALRARRPCAWEGVGSAACSSS